METLPFSMTMIFFLTSILSFLLMVSSSFKTKAEIGGREPVTSLPVLTWRPIKNCWTLTILVIRPLATIF